MSAQDLDREVRHLESTFRAAGLAHGQQPLGEIERELLEPRVVAVIVLEFRETRLACRAQILRVRLEHRLDHSEFDALDHLELLRIDQFARLFEKLDNIQNTVAGKADR